MTAYFAFLQCGKLSRRKFGRVLTHINADAKIFFAHKKVYQVPVMNHRAILSAIEVDACETSQCGVTGAKMSHC